MARSMKSDIERQDKYIEELHDLKFPCPFCERKLSFNEATKQDPDKDYEVHRICIHCNGKVNQAVPFIAAGRPWYWTRDETIKEYVSREGLEMLP